MKSLRNLSIGVVLLVLAANLRSVPGEDNVTFENRTAQAGIDFVLRNGATPERHQIETMTGGVAAFDFDNDGLLDLFFVNGAQQPSLEKVNSNWCNRLYRNRGDGTFEDVTSKAGICGAGFSMGVAVGDYDNDGRPDLFVAGVRRNILYRNRGNGTFEDTTSKSGIHGEDWSVGGGWFDYDGDGFLDLFVVNYTAWDPKTEPVCRDERTRERMHCHPRLYRGLPNTLYRNRGDGTFEDVSVVSGIRNLIGKGMSVSFADYDNDGRPDIVVANDSLPNFLLHNEGKGVFRETALSAGVAFNDDGRALSSMGVDFRDVDNDGRPDLFLTALVHETYPLYRNLGNGLFADFTYRSKVGAATATTTGWGAGVFDFNNDGRKDLFAANGDLNENAAAVSSRPANESNTILVQLAGGTFEATPVGPPARHRGVAFGDFDNDGRVDIVVTRLGQTPLILRNSSAGTNRWLALKLIGSRSNRDGIGAIVRVHTAAGEQWNQAATAVGYASASDVRVHFGLGKATEATVEIRWPSGQVQRLDATGLNRYLTVREP